MTRSSSTALAGARSPSAWGDRQPDLFGLAKSAETKCWSPPNTEVSGFRSMSNVVTASEEAALISAIDTTPLQPFRFGTWEGKRLTSSFGWHYDFERGRIVRAPPIPGWLLAYRARLAGLNDLDPEIFSQALLIRYDPGATIGWHRDRPQFDHVLGLSLGARASLRLRRRVGPGRSGFERRTSTLEPRGGYALTGDVRHLWEHSIAPLEATRWSITFRSLSRTGHADIGLRRTGGPRAQIPPNPTPLDRNSQLGIDDDKH